ncbi:unnamed protein product, partial [Urochloa humidicola]
YNFHKCSSASVYIAVDTLKKLEEKKQQYKRDSDMIQKARMLRMRLAGFPLSTILEI